MKAEKREARMREIEMIAYDLFELYGFDGTSMLAVAKAAKASNETLYRWYGDKNGLFLSMVRANAAAIREVLEAKIDADASPLDGLRQVAPSLLMMLLGNRAIALNRAAASDPTGALGRALATGGRQEVFPLLQRLLADAVQKGLLAAPQHGEIGTLFIHLLVGDQQVRRVIGTLAAPSQETVNRQATCAMAQLEKLCAIEKSAP